MGRTAFFIVFMMVFLTNCSNRNFVENYEEEEIIALNDVSIYLFNSSSGYIPKKLPPRPLSDRVDREDSLLYEQEIKFIEEKFEEINNGIIDTTFWQE